MFGCGAPAVAGLASGSTVEGYQYRVEVHLADARPMGEFSHSDEKYKFSMAENKFVLSAGKYPGIVRAIETLAQTFHKDEEGWSIRSEGPV